MIAHSNNATTQYLLPLCNKIGIRILVLEQVVIQLPWNGFTLVEEIVNVPWSLMVNAEHGPWAFHYPFSFVWFVLDWKVKEKPIVVNRHPVSWTLVWQSITHSLSSSLQILLALARCRQSPLEAVLFSASWSLAYWRNEVVEPVLERRERCASASKAIYTASSRSKAVTAAHIDILFHPTQAYLLYHPIIIDDLTCNCP